MKTKMRIIKKVCFCTKLFKNTIFTMYEWWRFHDISFALKGWKLKECSNIKTAASNLNYLLLNVFRFAPVINLILRIISVYSFTLNFLILLFPTFCNKLILSPVYSFFLNFCNKWMLSLTILCFGVLGLFRTFHTHTLMLDARPTIFSFGVLGLLSSFSFF